MESTWQANSKHLGTTAPWRSGRSRAVPLRSARAEYQALCQDEPLIPIFSQPWWLDATAGTDQWNVALVKQGREIVATMPYVVRRHYGLTRITHPPLTQTLGPWIRPAQADHSAQVKYQHKLLKALLDQLPPFDYFDQQWHHSNTDWLPFYWAGFKQTTRYTYIIDDLSDLNVVLAGFSNGRQRNIQRAEEAGIQIRFDIPAETFYQNYLMTRAQSGSKIPYSYDLFRRIYDSARHHGAACTAGAYDSQGNLRAAAFIIWDENSAYAPLNTLDQRYRGSGATKLLTREILRHVSTRTRSFDFQGGMIKSVEGSLREFNTRQVPYFRIFKVPSRLYAMAQFAKSMTGRR